MKKIFIILAVLGFILIGSVIVFFLYRSTPTYALKQLAGAITSHDTERFEEYVDMDATTDGVLRTLVKACDENMIASALCSSTLKPMLKEYLLKCIDTDSCGGNSFGDESRFRGVSSTVEVMKKLKYCGIKNIKKEGKLATVDVCFNYADQKEGLTLELKLKNKKSKWSLVNLSNLGYFIVKLQPLIEAQKYAEMSPLEKEEMDKKELDYVKQLLFSFRSAIQVFYGDHEGVFPTKMEELMEDHKYLNIDEMPYIKLLGHAKTNSLRYIYSSTESPKDLTDSGGYVYYASPKYPGTWGSFKLDCTHKNNGKFVYEY